MPDSKITALTSILTSTDPVLDQMVIVDVSDTSMAGTGTTKRVSLNQLLGASGTATLASATITGDLTVDTSTLKVDSANNRVGIGTASPESNLDVRGLIAVRGTPTFPSTGVGIESYYSAANTSSFIQSYDRGASAFANLSYSALAHIWQISGGESMRLNSTGLGVGTSPVSKLTVSDAAAYPIRVVATAGTTAGIEFQDPTTGATRPNIASRGAALTIETGGSERLRIDTSGNLGIGVTPSAWAAGYRAIQISSNQSTALMGSGNQTELTTNAFYDGAWKYQGAGTVAASRYSQQSGVHYWYTAAAGAAGTAIGSGFSTAAMTLDASGNLLVGTTDTSSTSGAGFKIIGSGLGPYVVNAASTNAALAYTMYSTGAAAYRFYVGWGGTVFATNTTISAISDARLKENVQDIDVGLGAILALKPRKFDWKEGKGKNIKGDRGFIAQEFEQVFPQLVDEWKDEAPEGEDPYKSVRQDLIPVLVKAIQELAARVQTLETR